MKDSDLVSRILGPGFLVNLDPEKTQIQTLVERAKKEILFKFFRH